MIRCCLMASPVTSLAGGDWLWEHSCNQYQKPTVYRVSSFLDFLGHQVLKKYVVHIVTWSHWNKMKLHRRFSFTLYIFITRSHFLTPQMSSAAFFWGFVLSSSLKKGFDHLVYCEATLKYPSEKKELWQHWNSLTPKASWYKIHFFEIPLWVSEYHFINICIPM